MLLRILDKINQRKDFFVVVVVRFIIDFELEDDSISYKFFDDGSTGKEARELKYENYSITFIHYQTICEQS